VEDEHQDTLIHAGILKARLHHIGFESGEIVLAQVILQDAYLNMRRYKGDKKPNLSMFIDKFKSDGPPKEKKPGGKTWRIIGRSLILDECNVRVRNDEVTARDADFLPNDIRIGDVSGKLSDFTFRSDSILFKVENLSAVEGSGLVLREFASEVLICPREMTFRNFKMRTPRSDLSGYYSMRYRNWSAFGNFVDSVTLVADLDLSNINLADISFFAGNLRGIEADFRFKGGVKGPLSNLKGNDIAIYFGSVTQVVGRLELSGLPDINNTFIYFDLNKLVTSYNDLRTIPVPPFSQGARLNIPPEVARLGVIRFSGNFTGFIKDFTAYGDLQTSIGYASMDVKLHQDEAKAMNYEGSLNVQNFDIGKLLNNEKLLGKVSLNGQVKGKEFSLKKTNAQFDGNISSLEFKGYTYHDIQATAFFKEQTFGGLVEINDTNAQVVFNGTINFSQPKRPVFNFYSTMKNVELAKLNFMKSDSSVRFQSTMRMEFSGISVDDIVGSIKVFDTEYSVGSSTYTLDTLTVTSQLLADSVKRIELKSSFVDADFNGKFKFVPLYNEMKRRFNEVVPTFAMKVDEKIKPIDQNFDFNIQLKKTDQLTALFLPQLSMARNSIVYGNYDSRRNDLSLNVKSSSVKFQNFEFRELSLNADNRGDELNVRSEVAALYLMDSIKVDAARLDLRVFRDSMEVTAGFQNSTEKMNSMFIHGSTNFANAPRYEFRLSDSYFYFNDSLWRINNENLVVIDKNLLEFENLQLIRAYNKEPLLVIDGRSEKGKNDSIQVAFEKFPLDLLNFFLARNNITLAGTAQGDVSLYRLFDQPYFTSSMDIGGLGLNGIPLGDIDISSSYNADERSLLVNTTLMLNGQKTVSIENGKFYPFRKEDQFDIHAGIKDLNLSAFSSFAEPIFSDISGSASGRFDLTGTAKNPQMNAELNVRNGSIRIVYLNAFLNLDMDPDKNIVLTNKSIQVPPIRLTDRYDGLGYLKGTISHNMFRDIELDLNVSARNLCLMETTPRLNEQFYGKAFASGTADIEGPLTDLVVSAKMKTNRNTVLNIPIRGNNTVAENGFVTFVNKKMDTTQAVVPIIAVKPKSNFSVNLEVEVTPDATVRIVFDETVGDVLTAAGNSDEIRLEIDTKGKFNIYGFYQITKGNYLFTLQNVINKPFTIKPGSSISFSGNPYNASINATAIYQANASLYPIVSQFMDEETARNYRRTTRVNCELTLTNTLANMLISFNLDLPSVDESTRGMVRAAISTEEEMNRQVFALLVLNQFLPPETTGGGGNANLVSSVGSTSFELLSGQLNNWLSKVTNNVNVNVNYKAGDQSTTDQVSVALSTQFFNDRVTIDGDVGVGGGQKVTDNANQNQIVGNVTVEAKVNKKGNLRVKAFNRANDNNLLKNSAPYTQGVGISYRIEFDSWNDLIRKRKDRKKTIEEKNQEIREQNAAKDTLRMHDSLRLKGDTLKIDTIRFPRQ